MTAGTLWKTDCVKSKMRVEREVRVGREKREDEVLVVEEAEEEDIMIY